MVRGSRLRELPIRPRTTSDTPSRDSTRTGWLLSCCFFPKRVLSRPAYHALPARHHPLTRGSVSIPFGHNAPHVWPSRPACSPMASVRWSRRGRYRVEAGRTALASHRPEAVVLARPDQAGVLRPIGLSLPLPPSFGDIVAEQVSSTVSRCGGCPGRHPGASGHRVSAGPPHAGGGSRGRADRGDVQRTVAPEGPPDSPGPDSARHPPARRHLDHHGLAEVGRCRRMARDETWNRPTALRSGQPSSTTHRASRPEPGAGCRRDGVSSEIWRLCWARRVSTG